MNFQPSFLKGVVSAATLSLVSASLAIQPSLSAELGVSNTYGHSFRSGTGSSSLKFETNTQISEQSQFGALKLETNSYRTGSMPGNGNGNDDRRPSSSPSNPGNPNEVFTGNSLAGSFSLGSRNLSETTRVTGSSSEKYTFSSSEFSHSVGAFSR